MISVSITTNLKSFKDDWLRAMRDMKKADEMFLEKERPRLQKHVTLKVTQAVYHTPFKPYVYKRTYHLRDSMRVYFPNPSDKHRLLINSDESIAPAVDGNGGYAKYVAGDSGSIGFLKTQYPNRKGGMRKSYFPRKWDDAIINGNSPYYHGLEATLTERYYRSVLKRLEKFS
jgi:hypothetical protein